MMGIKPVALLALTTLAFIPASSLRAEERMRAGLWENTVTSSGRTAKNTHCITPAEAETANASVKAMRESAEQAIAKSGKGACTLKDFSLVGNTRTSRMECGAISYVNTTTYRGDTFETVSTNTNAGVTTKSIITGRRISACP
jgi:hypothetical protein